MSVTVRIPTPLRSATGGQAIVAVDGATAGEVIHALVAAHPEVTARLLDEDGRLRRFVNVFIDDADIRFDAGLDTAVADGATVSIIPAVAGG